MISTIAIALHLLEYVAMVSHLYTLSVDYRLTGIRAIPTKSHPYQCVIHGIDFRFPIGVKGVLHPSLLSKNMGSTSKMKM